MGNCFISPFLILLDYGAGHGSIEDEDSTSQLPFDPHTFFYGNITECRGHGLGNQESVGSHLALLNL